MEGGKGVKREIRVLLFRSCGEACGEKGFYKTKRKERRERCIDGMSQGEG